MTVIGIAVVLGALVPRPTTGETNEGPYSQEILLISNPIHTDIAVRLDDKIRERFRFLKDGGVPVDAAAAQWLIVGWGGRAFYLETPTWSDLKPVPVFKALTVDKSVLRVDVTAQIDIRHPAITRLRISDSGYEQLLQGIMASFTRVDGMPLPIIGAAYGPNDAFYEAEGWFNLLVGCNLWSSRMLQHAGLKVGWWTPLPLTLRWSLRTLNGER